MKGKGNAVNPADSYNMHGRQLWVVTTLVPCANSLVFSAVLGVRVQVLAEGVCSGPAVKCTASSHRGLLDVAACAAGLTEASFGAPQDDEGGGSKTWPTVGSGHHPDSPSPGSGIYTSQAGIAVCSGRWPWIKLLFLQLRLPGE